MQVVQFAINPLSALGVYGYCAWRLGRPLAGLIGALLYLLSPIAWTFLVDWGFYANEAGDVFFMPALIALDAFFTRWQQGDRGWLMRAGALAFMGLAALLSYVSPAIVGGPFLTAFAYVLAVRGGWLEAGRWLVAVVAVSLGSLALAAFWVVPANEWLAVVASRHPAPAYGPDLFHPWSLQQVLQLRPVRPTVIEDRTSLSPAVWVPAPARSSSLAGAPRPTTWRSPGAMPPVRALSSTRRWSTTPSFTRAGRCPRRAWRRCERTALSTSTP